MRISDWSSDVCSSDLHAGGIMETELVLGIYIRLQGRKFALFEEGADDFLALAVLRNGEDLHFPTLFDRQLIQHRHFDHARSAPRRPQVDQQRLAPEIRQRDIFAVWALEWEIRCGFPGMAGVDGGAERRFASR